MSTDTVSVMTVEDIEGVPKAVVDRHIELTFTKVAPLLK